MSTGSYAPIPVYVEGTFTPTVTLIGGAGNTVPVYSTNSGRYTRIGNRVLVEIYLNGDGGNEGAGTGTIEIALPFTAGANMPGGNFSAGSITNNTESQPAYGFIQAGTATVAVRMQTDTAGALNSTITGATGADQNNTTRSIRLQFSYEV